MVFPLFLNDVAGSEIIVIILVVLIFFGSKSIPGIAKTLGKTMYQIRNATAEVQNEIKKSGVDIKEDLNISNLINSKKEEILAPMDQVYSEIENTIHYSPITRVSENSSEKEKVEDETKISKTPKNNLKK